MQLFVNARFLTQPLTGVQRYGIEISRQIRAHYPEAVFLTPNNVKHAKIANELSALRIGNLTGHLWEQISLPRWLSKKHHPVLFNPGNTAPLRLSNNFVTIHDLAFVHAREWNHLMFNAFYNFLVPKIARNAKHVFTVSEAIKAELIANFKIPPDKISVTYNGIPLLFQTKEGVMVKEKLILAVGSFNARKNHDKLVEAFLKSDLVHNYKLVIVGNASRIFKETQLQLQNHPAVIIKERLSDEQLVNYYKRAEIVVSLSSYEGFGIPVLEALYFDCKVLCSNIAAYKELYKKYVYFCDPQNIADVSKSLSRLANSKTHPPIDLLLSKYNYKSSAEIVTKQIAFYSRETLT